MTINNDASRVTTHLLSVDDLNPGFDVGEVVGRGQDGLALVLLVKVPVRVPALRERRREDEPN